MNLTPRQAEILKAIIEEHISSAQPIASVELVIKRGLAVSGATVRNVMAELVRRGYLRMMHVSSGRTPTDRAYRYYVNDLMIEEAVSVIEEMALKQKVWENRYEALKLVRSAAEALSEVTNYLAFGLTTDGYIHYAGASKILDIPEFYEIDVTKSVLKLVDDYRTMREIIQNSCDGRTISVLIGREIGLDNMEPVSMIFGSAHIYGNECYIGLIAPARTKYYKDIPLVRHMIKLLDEVGESDG